MISNVEGRLDNVEGRLDNVEGHLESIESRIGQLTKTLKSIRGYLKRKQKAEAAVGVIGALLNAMTCGIAGPLLQSAMGTTLCQIVDFADIGHIAAVASSVASSVGDVTVQESLTLMLEKTTDFASNQTEAAIAEAVKKLADNLDNGGHHRAGDEALLMTLVLTSRMMTIAAADSQVSPTRSTKAPTIAAPDSQVSSTRSTKAPTIVDRLHHLEKWLASTKARALLS